MYACSSLLCLIALLNISALASLVLAQGAATTATLPMFETSQPVSTISSASPTNTDSFDPGAIPPELQGRVPDGMTLWYKITGSFAFYRNSACQFGPYRYPRFLYSSWPLIVAIGNDAQDICDSVYGPSTYKIENAMSLFTDYGHAITDAVKVTLYSQPNANAAYNYWNSTLKGDSRLQMIVCNPKFQYIGVANCGTAYKILLADNQWDLSSG